MSKENDESVRDERESRLRSLLKAITYRITGTIATTLLVLVATGEMSVAFTVGALEPFVKVVIYYLHERAWQMVPPGTVRRLFAR